jgi:hypothetical protein
MHEEVFEHEDMDWKARLENKKPMSEVVGAWMKSIQFHKGAKRSQLRLPKQIAERLGVAPDVILEGGVLRTTNGQELWRRS